MLPTSGSGIMLLFIFAFYALLFAYAVVAYVFQGISLQTLAKRRGIAHRWLAWIPYGTNWILGAIASDYDKRNGIKRRWDKILLITSLVVAVSAIILEVIAFIFMTTMIVNMSSGFINEEDMLIIVMFMYLSIIPIIFLTSIYNILATICIFKLFESTVPQKTLVYFLLYYIVPFAAPFCLFACRNKGYSLPEQIPDFLEIN